MLENLLADDDVELLLPLGERRTEVELGEVEAFMRAPRFSGVVGAPLISAAERRSGPRASMWRSTASFMTFRCQCSAAERSLGEEPLLDPSSDPADRSLRRLTARSGAQNSPRHRSRDPLEDDLDPL